MIQKETHQELPFWYPGTGSVVKSAPCIFFVFTVIAVADIAPDVTVVNHRHPGRLGNKVIMLATAALCAHTHGATFVLDCEGPLRHFQVSKTMPLLRDFKTSSNKLPWLRPKGDSSEVPIPGKWYMGCHVPIGKHSFECRTHVDRYENVMNHIWIDEALSKKLQDWLVPVIAIDATLPEGSEAGTTIAVHVRKPNGADPPLASQQWFKSDQTTKYFHFFSDLPVSQFDDWTTNKIIHPGPCADQHWPAKFPPEQYYYDAISYLHEMLGGPIRVYVFGDRSVGKIAERFASRSTNKQIQYIPVAPKRGIQGALGDLVLMSQCDCFIRSCSTFAQAAQLMGKHRVVIRPGSFQWSGKELHVTKACVYERR